MHTVMALICDVKLPLDVCAWLWNSLHHPVCTLGGWCGARDPTGQQALYCLATSEAVFSPKKVLLVWPLAAAQVAGLASLSDLARHLS